MKVKHLIEELQKCNPESEVDTEGCDCWGNSFAVIKLDNDSVLIVRSDAEYSYLVKFPYNNCDPTPHPL